MTHQIGRLAFRVEGKFWNAYYAPLDTMKGAVFLGGIAMAIAAKPARKAAFMALMKDAVSDLLETATDGRVTWPHNPVPAPEHERTKE